MNVDGIFVKARRDCFIELSDYLDADAIIDLNFRYDYLNMRIIDEVDEDIYWDSSVDDTVVGQSEYPIETTGTGDDLKNIIEVNKIYIKYTATAEPLLARRVSPLSLVKHPDWYSENHSASDPIYYVQDNSVFIYPAPTEAVSAANSGIEIFTINMPIPLVIGGDEASIKLPRRFHRLLPMGLKQDIFAKEGKINEKNDAIAEFERAADKMIQEFRDRDQGEIIEHTPNLSHLE